MNLVAFSLGQGGDELFLFFIHLPVERACLGGLLLQFFLVRLLRDLVLLVDGFDLPLQQVDLLDEGIDLALVVRLDLVLLVVESNPRLGDL